MQKDECKVPRETFDDGVTATLQLYNHHYRELHGSLELDRKLRALLEIGYLFRTL